MTFLTRIFRAADGRLRPGWRALLFLPAYVALVLTGFTGVVFFTGREWLTADVELRLLFSGLIGLASGCLAAWVLLYGFDRRSFRTLGLWGYAGWARDLGLGLVGGCLMVSAVVGLLVALGRVEFTGVKLEAAGAARGLAWCLLLLVPAAANEEVLFRGYPFQRLVEAWGRVAAVLVLSALFGVAHLRNPAHTLISTANTVLVGVLIALLYLKTRGLWLPIAFHFAWNFAMGFVYSLPVSGIVLSAQPWSVRIGGPAWLSGGNYGPEGSVVTTGVVLAVTGWLARTRRLGVSPALAKELQ